MAASRRKKIVKNSEKQVHEGLDVSETGASADARARLDLVPLLLHPGAGLHGRDDQHGGQQIDY